MLPSLSKARTAFPFGTPEFIRVSFYRGSCCPIFSLLFSILSTIVFLFDHCFVCLLKYSFCLPYWYPQTVLKNRNKSHHLLSVYMNDCCLATLSCLSFELQLLLTLLVSTNCSQDEGQEQKLSFSVCVYEWLLLSAIVLSVFWITASTYLIGIHKLFSRWRTGTKAII